MNISAGADVIIARPPLAQVSDLRGRRVGVEQTAVGAYMLQGALQQAGLKVGEVTVVPLPIDEHVAAWRSGSVDALVTFDPARHVLLHEGGRRFLIAARCQEKSWMCWWHATAHCSAVSSA